jgi:class I fructose-bisphosphate aldolase
MMRVDQGREHGPGRSFAPNLPAYDPLEHFRLGIDAELNAYASPLVYLGAGTAESAG